MAYSMPPHGDPTNVMGRRIAAYIIDALISSAVLVAVLALTKDHSYVHAPTDACQSLKNAGFSGRCVQLGSRVYTWKAGGFAAGYLVSLGVSFANNVLLQGSGGASIGKLILGLRVVDGAGQVASIGRNLVRWLLLIVDAVFCFLIGLITASVTHPHRRVGDMVASTYVIGVADLGRPVVAAVSAYQYGYGQPPGGGWAPPGAATPGWGGAAQQPSPPAWGAPPPPPEQQGWGQPQPPAAAPGWGQPQPAPPAWGAPPPPTPEAAPPAWGAPPPPSAAPESAPPAWGAPPTPAPPPPAAPPAWDQPAPAPSAAPPAWEQPAPPPSPAPPAWDQPAPAPPSPAAPPAWDQPAPAPTPPPPPTPDPTPAPPPVPDVPPPPAAAPDPKPAPPAPGESWWDKALGDEDDEPRQ